MRFLFSALDVRDQTVEQPVNLAALLPTLLDHAGLDVPPDVEFPSFASALRGNEQISSKPVFSEIDYGGWVTGTLGPKTVYSTNWTLTPNNAETSPRILRCRQSSTD